jgi:hypothetical protein
MLSELKKYHQLWLFPTYEKVVNEFIDHCVANVNDEQLFTIVVKWVQTNTKLNHLLLPLQYLIANSSKIDYDKVRLDLSTFTGSWLDDRGSGYILKHYILDVYNVLTKYNAVTAMKMAKQFIEKQ